MNLSYCSHSSHHQKQTKTKEHKFNFNKWTHGKEHVKLRTSKFLVVNLWIEKNKKWNFWNSIEQKTERAAFHSGKNSDKSKQYFASVSFVQFDRILCKSGNWNVFVYSKFLIVFHCWKFWSIYLLLHYYCGIANTNAELFSVSFNLVFPSVSFLFSFYFHSCSYRVGVCMDYFYYDIVNNTFKLGLVTWIIHYKIIRKKTHTQKNSNHGRSRITRGKETL